MVPGRYWAAFVHRLCGPLLAKKATIRFDPVIPLFPQAVFTSEVKDESASTHFLLHPVPVLPCTQSVDAQPLMVCVYTALQRAGRFDTRGVKSARLTAMLAVGSAKSTNWSAGKRMVVGRAGVVLRYYRDDAERLSASVTQMSAVSKRVVVEQVARRRYEWYGGGRRPDSTDTGKARVVFHVVARYMYA